MVKSLHFSGTVWFGITSRRPIGESAIITNFKGEIEKKRLCNSLRIEIDLVGFPVFLKFTRLCLLLFIYFDFRSFNEKNGSNF
jgi:hypothetical protein